MLPSRPPGSAAIGEIQPVVQRPPSDPKHQKATGGLASLPTDH